VRGSWLRAFPVIFLAFWGVAGRRRCSLRADDAMVAPGPAGQLQGRHHQRRAKRVPARGTVFCYAEFAYFHPAPGRPWEGSRGRRSLLASALLGGWQWLFAGGAGTLRSRAGPLRRTRFSGRLFRLQPGESAVKTGHRTKLGRFSPETRDEYRLDKQENLHACPINYGRDQLSNTALGGKVLFQSARRPRNSKGGWGRVRMGE